MFATKAGVFGRLFQLMLGDIDQLHGRSKLRTYADLTDELNGDEPLLEDKRNDRLSNEAILNEYGIVLPPREQEDENLVADYLE